MFIVIFITAKLSILSSSSSSLISSSSWWSIRRWLWLWSVISLFVVLINISVWPRCWSHLIFLLLYSLLLSLFCYNNPCCYYLILLLLSLLLTSLIHRPWQVYLLLIGNCHLETSPMWKLQIIVFWKFFAISYICNYTSSSWRRWVVQSGCWCTQCQSPWSPLPSTSPSSLKWGRKRISDNEDVGESEEGRKNEESDSDDSDDHNIDCKGEVGRVQRDGDGKRGRKQKRTNVCLLVESVILHSTSI